uniref:Uncharacterized protein n=1 Tax=Streptomyces kanamyceticus TaxID=1967 RepID=E9KTE9_STRKN|nr:hypothetical protein Tcs_SK_065 [Streptomyces kanamyceticus]
MPMSTPVVLPVLSSQLAVGPLNAFVAESYRGRGRGKAEEVRG